MQSQKPVVLVTGAASGMGKAVMEKFQREQWEVIAIDRCEMAHQPGITAVTADITQYAALREAVATALEGRHIHAMINAAGIFPTSTLESSTDALYRLIFDVNVLGSVNMAKVASEFISPRAALSCCSPRWMLSLSPLRNCCTAHRKPRWFLWSNRWRLSWWVKASWSMPSLPAGWKPKAP